MPRSETSSRDASRPAPSAPMSPDPDFPIAWEFSEVSEPPGSPAPTISSGDAAPARADHRPGTPVMLEVSPFSFAATNLLCGRGNRAAGDSYGDRSRSERSRIADHARGRTRRGQEPFGKGDVGLRVAGWLPMHGRTLLRKRRTISVSALRRDNRKQSGAGGEGR